MQGRAGFMSKPKYLTFPIILLSDAMTDIKGSIDDVFDYCLYYQCQRLDDEDSIEEASNILGINFCNANKSYELGRTLFDSIETKAPKASIRTGMLFDFYKNKKEEFEVVCFLAFAAIRSIIQRQKYKKLTNQYLFSRMSGNSSSSEDINPLLKKYLSRHQTDKIKKELQRAWGLKYYAEGTRGFYVSFAYPIKTLAMIAMENNKKYKDKLIDAERKEAKRIAQEVIRIRCAQAGINWSDYVSKQLSTPIEQFKSKFQA
jgi:hypothetical protein